MRGLLSILATMTAFVGVGGAIVLSRVAPDLALWFVLAVIVGTPLLWFLGCTLIPGVEQRTCPQCKAEALEPMDMDSRYGVRCAACGHEDPDVPTARLGHEPPAR